MGGVAGCGVAGAAGLVRGAVGSELDATDTLSGEFRCGYAGRRDGGDVVDGAGSGGLVDGAIGSDCDAAAGVSGERGCGSGRDVRDVGGVAGCGVAGAAGLVRGAVGSELDATDTLSGEFRCGYAGRRDGGDVVDGAGSGGLVDGAIGSD